MKSYRLPRCLQGRKRRMTICPMKGNRRRLPIDKTDHDGGHPQRPNHPHHRQGLPIKRMTLVRDDHRFQLMFVRWGILR